MRKSLIILMVLSLTVGCASLKPKFLGKRFPESPYYLSVNEKTFTNYSNVTRKVNMKHLILHLKPALNKNDGTAQVTGKIIFKEDKVPSHGRVEKFTVHAFILDKDYVCVEKVSFRDLAAYSFGRTFRDDLLFDVSFPYRSNYAYVTFDYNFGYYQ
jgi:hypothetical protein